MDAVMKRGQGGHHDDPGGHGRGHRPGREQDRDQPCPTRRKYHRLHGQPAGVGRQTLGDSQGSGPVTVIGCRPLESPNPVSTVPEWRAAQAAAGTLRIALRSVEVRTAEDFVNALSALSRQRPAGLMMIMDTLTIPYRNILADFAVENRVPAIFGLRVFAEAGGLLSYGPSLPAMFRDAASYMVTILKGAPIPPSCLCNNRRSSSSWSTSGPRRRSGSRSRPRSCCAPIA
jgi:hypothetical protein